MIVRLLHEGQFRVSGADYDALNELDNQLVAAIAADDQARFTALMKQMNKLVHERGKPVPVDEFIESDVILPDPDSDIEEVRDLFSGDGLIPG